MPLLRRGGRRAAACGSTYASVLYVLYDVCAAAEPIAAHCVGGRGQHDEIQKDKSEARHCEETRSESRCEIPSQRAVESEAASEAERPEARAYGRRRTRT